MLSHCPEFINATRSPEKAAFSWNGRSISWMAVNNYVHSTSRYLKEISVKKDGRVIVVTERSPAFYIVLLALWRIGACVCPVVGSCSEADVDAVYSVIKPDFVIGQRAAMKLWAKGVRSADIEHVVAYGYNDSFLGSEAALDPKIELEYPALLRLGSSPSGLEGRILSHEALRLDPQELAAFFKALSTGDKFIIP